MSQTETNSNATSPMVSSPSVGSTTPLISNSSTTTTTTTTTNSGNNNNDTSFNGVLEIWRSFDIEKKKIDLGEFVSQIGDSKEDCLKSRKVLAKQTQDFKKIPDEEKIKSFSQLLKLYQEEVDKLTKRSKFSETCFLGLYKEISEVSDPVPALSAALEEASKVDNSGKLEIENKKLQTELQEFKKEFQEIQNQEVTIRRLEDKIKEQETRIESMIQDKVASRESEVRQEMQDRINSLQQDKADLQRQSNNLQEENTKLSKINYEAQSQLMEMRNKYDGDGHSKQSEIDILTNELERVSGKLSTLQTENLSIREESQREKTSLNNFVKRISDLELELLSRETDISKFVDLNSELKLSNKKDQDRIQELQQQVQIEREKNLKLDNYIKENPSPLEYENMKKELVALQSIVGSEELSNPNSDKLLKEKNRQLESESTRLRLQLSSLENEISDKSQIINDQSETIEKQNQLIINIEKDLNILNLNQQQQHQFMQQNQHQQQQQQQQDISEILINNSNPLNQSTSSTSSFVQIDNPNNNILSPISSVTNAVLGQTKENDKTFEIVIGQRDRYKIKIDQLELEKSQLEKRLENSNLEINSLKNDNIKLYEKIRFLQTFDKNSSRSNNGGNNSINNSKRYGHNSNTGYDIENRGGGGNGTNTGDPEERYGKLYEESINPFLSFNKKEKYRRYKEMNTAERVILNGSRFFLSNKYSRLFLFIYSILLHLLVFVTLYRLAVTTTEQHQYLETNNINPNAPPLPLDDKTNDIINVNSSNLEQ